jgi:hypothetical protein
MKVGYAHVFWTPWWDVDHHVYGCPIEIIVHRREWVLMVRPFSNFAQGGDRRGENAWFETRQGPSPYEREQVAKWVLSDQKPEIWASVTRHREHHRTSYCVVCLHDVEGCTAVHGGRHTTTPARRLVFPRHLWRVHVARRQRCRIRIKDLEEVERPGV